MRQRCETTAFYIASDRVSRFLPSAASTCVFFIQLTASFWKTLNALEGDDTYDKSNPVSAGLNRAPHNIAFGALFFWLPFVVLLTAWVGGCNTPHLVPEILDCLRIAMNSSTALGDPNTDRPRLPDLGEEADKRWLRGGLPVWQPAKFADFFLHPTTHKRFYVGALLSSFAIVALPTACAITISWTTPAEGFGCRAVTQLSFLGLWVGSLMIDRLLYIAIRNSFNRDPEVQAASRRTHLIIYVITFIKDIAFTIGTIVTLTFTAIGIFNNCECWSKYPHGAGYISFPQDRPVFQLIKHRLKTWQPASGQTPVMHEDMPHAVREKLIALLSARVD